MTEETSTVAHLSDDAITTHEIDKVQATDGNSVVSSYSLGTDFYLRIAVIVMGVVGTAGNALILYALIASKQHKKQALIVNQNVLDLASSIFLVIIYSVQITRPRLSGVLGYWLCILLLSENPIWSATNASMVNLAIITIDRYLKVVYPVFSRKWIRPWVIKLAMAAAWFIGFAFNTIVVVFSSAVIDGDCHSYEIYNSQVESMIATLFYLGFFYFIILIIFIFCYWRILLAIRRQARVMASHSAAGRSIANPCQRIVRHCMDAMQYLLSAEL